MPFKAKAWHTGGDAWSAQRTLRLGFHEGEVDDIPNRLAVGEEHDEAVDADAEASCGGHADFEGVDEFVVHFGHGVFFGLALELGFEEFFLEPGVVEFGVGVGEFHAFDVEFEAFGDRRVVLLALGERADGGWVVDHEDGAFQRVFDEFFEELVDDDVVVDVVGEDAFFLGEGDDFFMIGHGEACGGFEEVGVFFAWPGWGEVDGFVAPWKDEAFAFEAHLLFNDGGCVANDGLGEVHHGLVVAVGLIDFDHREFGVVCCVDPFVAEDAADFVDPFDAADHETLEVKLKGNSHVELDVEGVVVCDEGAGGCTAGDGVEDGGFDFYEAVAAQSLADGVDDRGAEEHAIEDAVVVDEVEVAVAQEGFDVVNAVEFFRWRGD